MKRVYIVLSFCAIAWIFVILKLFDTNLRYIKNPTVKTTSMYPAIIIEKGPFSDKVEYNKTKYTVKVSCFDIGDTVVLIEYGVFNCEKVKIAEKYLIKK